MSVLTSKNAPIQGPMSEIRIREIALLFADGTIRELGEYFVKEKNIQIIKEVAKVTAISEHEATVFIDTICARVFKKTK